MDVFLLRVDFQLKTVTMAALKRGNERIIECKYDINNIHQCHDDTCCGYINSIKTAGLTIHVFITISRKFSIPR